MMQQNNKLCDISFPFKIEFHVFNMWIRSGVDVYDLPKKGRAEGHIKKVGE